VKKPSCKQVAVPCAVLLCVAGLGGCSTVGGTAADLGLAGAGGTIGYEAFDHKIGGAAAGAAAGIIASKVAQSEVQRTVQDAEKSGYDRAMNQTVKQQYWIIQNQQRQPAQGQDVRLVPVLIPESKINGVIQKAHIEYLRIES
jgi:hypothetical protein